MTVNATSAARRGHCLWAAIAALCAGFAIAPVLLSHDVYSYVDYARLGVVHGLNPYLHPPAAAPLDPAFAGVTWIDTSSAYGPPWASFGLLLATAWLLPWYLIWALPLVALSRDRPLQLLTLALTAFQLPARMPL